MFEYVSVLPSIVMWNRSRRTHGCYLFAAAPPPSDRTREPTSKPYNAYIKAELFLPTPSATPSSNFIFANRSESLEYRSKAQTVHPMTGDLNFTYPTTATNDTNSAAEEWDDLWWKKKQTDQGLQDAVFEWEVWETWEELTFLR